MLERSLRSDHLVAITTIVAAITVIVTITSPATMNQSALYLGGRDSRTVVITAFEKTDQYENAVVNLGK